MPVSRKRIGSDLRKVDRHRPTCSDYADVPPTRGVFQGASAVRAELNVAVTVGPAMASTSDAMPFVPWMTREAEAPIMDQASSQLQQQQQQ